MSEHRAAVRVRAATPDDATAIGRAHVAAWRSAYVGQLPQALLDSLDPAQSAEGWRRLVDRDDGDGGGGALLVAEIDGAVVGFASLGAHRDGGREGVLYAVNVHPDSWGLGAGAALLDAVETALAKRGFERATLWVLPGNQRARRFYERNGWLSDEVLQHEVLGGVLVEELRYSIALAGPQAPE